MRAAGGLVGRQIESARLSRLLTEDVERAVLVSGEPGVGKTTLIGQLSAGAAADGWQVVQVLGMEAEQSFALGGLNQMVFGLQEYISGLDDRDRAVLAPVLGGDSGAGMSALPLVMALLKLLTAAAQNGPVLLVLDDVHWLDSVSAEVLGAVGRRLNNPAVGIVAGRRTPYESSFSPVGWSELQLRPLDAEDSAQLLALVDVPLTAAKKAAILVAAAGNPLALTELPRGADQIDDAGTLPLTERLVAVFGRRLGGLDDSVRADLLHAALDGIAIGESATKRARIRSMASGWSSTSASTNSRMSPRACRAARLRAAAGPERLQVLSRLAGLWSSQSGGGGGGPSNTTIASSSGDRPASAARMQLPKGSSQPMVGITRVREGWDSAFTRRQVTHFLG